MMKRMVCLLLAMLLLCGSALARDYIDLPDKIMHQVELGSGLKVKVDVTANGKADWVEPFVALNGANIQIRYLNPNGTKQHQLLVYLLGGEKEQRAFTQIDWNDGCFTLSGDLPGGVYRIPFSGEVTELLPGQGEYNPSFMPALRKLMGMNLETTEWKRAVKPVQAELDAWLNTFSTAPKVNRTAEDGTELVITYDIPAEAVKKEIVNVLRVALNSSELVSLLSSVMTEEQRFVYLNKNLMYYYEPLVMAIPLTGSLVLERRLTTVGEELGVSVKLPVDLEGWTSVAFAKDETGWSFAAEGEEKTITLTCKGTAEKGTYAFCMIPAVPGEDAPVIAVNLAAEKNFSTYVEEESTREHEITAWKLVFTSGAENVPEDKRAFVKVFEPVTITADLHFYSKNAQQSPTTGTIDVVVEAADAELKTAVTLMTTTPWVLREVPAGGTLLSGLQADDAAAVFADMWTGFQQENAAMNAPASPTDAQ